jgi:hypothetical protein
MVTHFYLFIYNVKAFISNTSSTNFTNHSHCGGKAASLEDPYVFCNGCKTWYHYVCENYADGEASAEEEWYSTANVARIRRTTVASSLARNTAQIFGPTLSGASCRAGQAPERTVGLNTH